MHPAMSFRTSVLAGLALTALLQTPCRAQAARAAPGGRDEVFARAPAPARWPSAAARSMSAPKATRCTAFPWRAAGRCGRLRPGGAERRRLSRDRLYVASRDRISAFVPTPDGDSPAADIHAGLPNLAHHGLRYIQAGPDGRLYVSIGSPCNICEPKGLQGSIVSLDPDGQNLQRVAWGIRNSAGFDWRRRNHVLHRQRRRWHGRRHPPDELNQLRPGAFYGFPYFGGGVGLEPVSRSPSPGPSKDARV